MDIVDETLTVTDKGMRVLIDDDTTITALETHVIMALLNTPLNMMDLVDTIQLASQERKFIDAKYVANAASKLMKHGYIKYHTSVTRKPNRQERRQQKYNSGGYK